MRQVPRRHTAPETVSDEKPWCVCHLGKTPGYRQHPDHAEEFYVHSKCLKPARMYWEVKVAGRTA
jgi:hypothetical protein